MQKNKICKKILLCMAMVIGIVSSFNPIVAKAQGSYNRDAALAFAAENWDSGKGLCSEFVSEALRAAGSSCYSVSASALRNQLVETGQWEEHIIPLENGAIKASDYPGQIEPGSVIFYHCSGCRDGRPFIHVVLSNGTTEDGYVKAYSHNNANAGTKKYVYSTRCYSCGGIVDAAYVYTFGGNHNPLGHLDSLEVNEKGQIIINGWCFDPDLEVAYLDTLLYFGDPQNPDTQCLTILANSSRPDVDKVYHTGEEHGFASVIDVPSSLYGTHDIYIYAANCPGTAGENVLLGVKTVTINKPFVLELEHQTLNMEISSSELLDIYFQGDGISSISYGFTDESICSFRFDNVNWTTGEGNGTISTKKAGDTVLTIYLNDSSGNVLKQESVSISVDAEPIYARPSCEEVRMVVGEETDVVLEFNCVDYGVTTIWPSFSDDYVAEVTYGTCQVDSLPIHIKAMTPGETILTYSFEDEQGNVVVETDVTVIVEEVVYEENEEANDDWWKQLWESGALSALYDRFW